MKYTKEQLQGMSDLEVSRVLELLLNPKAEFVGQHYVETGDGIYNNVIKYPEWPNYRECPMYCIDVSDIMPLAFEHKIGTQHFNRGTWQAHSQGDNVFHDKNPLRAIACCLILVLQDKGDL